MLKFARKAVSENEKASDRECQAHRGNDKNVAAKTGL